MTAPNENPRDLLPLYALDALDANELAIVERELEATPDLRTELAEYHETLAALAGAVEVAPSTPSPAVWEGIRQAIAGDAGAAEAPAFTPARDVKRRRFTTRVLGAVAAASFLAAAFFGLQLASRSSTDLLAAANELRNDPSARTVTLTDAGGLAVEAVLGDDGIGYIYADGLPTLGAGRAYQLWAINDNGVISAGIFGTDGVAPFHIDGDVAGLAITEEISGGVEASANDPVALWLEA